MGRHHKNPAYVSSEWSPHVEAAAKAMYKRLNVLKNKPRWRDSDIDSTDHYCIAAKLAIEAFHASAVKEIVVEI
jgi:hypothetical protein